jgi:F-type H+-transporting ATPase subunit a
MMNTINTISEKFAIDPISQFKVKKIYDLTLFGIDISITNSSIMMMFALLLFVITSYFSIRKKLVVPDKFQSVFEISFLFVENLFNENMNGVSKNFKPLIFSIFFYVFLGNLVGMIPFAFTFTSQITVTFSLAIFVFLLSVIVGISKNGLKFLKIFLPSGTPVYIFPLIIPIEIISFLSRPLSLGIRLFANMIAGHAMMKVFASFVFLMGIWGFIPFSVNIILIGFELVVAFLQAYIFSILTCTYIIDAIDLH